VFDSKVLLMKAKILIFGMIFGVTTPVFAQDQTVPEQGSASLQQENSIVIQSLATNDHYPSCHRMSNWSAKQPLKTVSTE
jgi:hypothetical protein